MFASFLTVWFGKRSGVVIARVLTYGLIILFIVGVYFYIRWDAYNDGVEDTTLKYQVIIQVERDRISEANQSALDASNSRIVELQRLLRNINEELSEIQREAEQDPNAARPSLGIGSVQRLNRLR